MFNNKGITNCISTLLLAVFLLPLTVLAFHSLTNHKHEICFSKTEQHIHDKDLDCTLHLYKQNHSFLSELNAFVTFKTKANAVIKLKNSFLKNHQQLSFSLRGPPSTVLM